jgi:uncharacterized membrane protein
VLVVVSASLGWLARAARDLHQQGRAQTVADLAALSAAGSDEGSIEAVASGVAADNGAQLVRVTRHGTTIGVTISLGGRTASAHASPGRTAELGP